MPPSREANGRTRVDGCSGAWAHARWISGASARVLPRTAPSCMINKGVIQRQRLFVFFQDFRSSPKADVSVNRGMCRKGPV